MTLRTLPSVTVKLLCLVVLCRSLATLSLSKGDTSENPIALVREDTNQLKTTLGQSVVKDVIITTQEERSPQKNKTLQQAAYDTLRLLRPDRFFLRKSQSNLSGLPSMAPSSRRRRRRDPRVKSRKIKPFNKLPMTHYGF